MVTATSQELEQVGSVLADPKTPLPARFRALFTLMNIGSDDAVKKICAVFVDDSELLKHELAFCLGQMQKESALPKLTEVLEDPTQPIIVRHEAGEAIGAIGLMKSLPLLEKYLTHDNQVLRETCELAVERIKMVQNTSTESPFSSVDPAPAFNKNKTVPELRDILISTSHSLFDRYRAMFSLRNIGTPESIDGLVAGLGCADSALLRHEVAYVLGQLADSHAIPGLAAKLRDLDDDPMVRHECAEALGALESAESRKILSDHLTDRDFIVKQSCEIALDMNQDEFQYADTLQNLREGS